MAASRLRFFDDAFASRPATSGPATDLRVTPQPAAAAAFTEGRAICNAAEVQRRGT